MYPIQTVPIPTELVQEVVGTFTSQSTVRPILVFLLSFTVTFLIGRYLVLRWLKRVLEVGKTDRALVSLSLLLGKVANVVFAFGVAFTLAGFGTFAASLTLLVATAAVTTGLVARDFLENVIAGTYIISEKLFLVGDWIEWDEYRGQVEAIDLRITKVRTFDNGLLTVPNSTLTRGELLNPVAFDRLRIVIQFNVGYEDIARVTETLLEVASANPDILDDPAPDVRITTLTETFVGLSARVWIRDPSRARFLRVRTEYAESVLEAFERDGIGPDPQLVELSGTVRSPPETLGGEQSGAD